MLYRLPIIILATAAISQSATTNQKSEEQARESNDRLFGSEAYRRLPWAMYSMQGFFPRDPPHSVAVDSDVANAFPPTRASDDYAPTKTKAMHLMPRRPQQMVDCSGVNECFTFACPTGVQCADGGCCSIEDYCAIKDGLNGCCPLNGPPCDTDPIPGCSLSCYGICCDLFTFDLIGQTVCKPTRGTQGQPSGTCTVANPVSSLHASPIGCPAAEFPCGDSCCPSDAGLICDNTSVPDSPFCNIPP